MTENPPQYITDSNWRNSDEQELHDVENSIAIFSKMLEKYEKRRDALKEQIKQAEERKHEQPGKRP